MQGVAELAGSQAQAAMKWSVDKSVACRGTFHEPMKIYIAGLNTAPKCNCGKIARTHVNASGTARFASLERSTAIDAVDNH